MVDTAQAKQGDSELLLALVWPKQLIIDPKDTFTHSNPKPGEEQEPQYHNETTTELHSPKNGRESRLPGLIGESINIDHN